MRIKITNYWKYKMFILFGFYFDSNYFGIHLLNFDICYNKKEIKGDE